MFEKLFSNKTMHVDSDQTVELMGMDCWFVGWLFALITTVVWQFIILRAADLFRQYLINSREYHQDVAMLFAVLLWFTLISLFICGSRAFILVIRTEMIVDIKHNHPDIVIE
jgi:hypothetical protein